MDSEVLSCLLKFIEYSPRLPFGIVAYAFTLFWTTFVETDVCIYIENSFYYGAWSTGQKNEKQNYAHPHPPPPKKKKKKETPPQKKETL